MCEYCDGQIRKGQNVFVYFSDLALGWTLELKDLEFSMMVAINYCPFCGRNLKEDTEWHDPTVDYMGLELPGRNDGL